METPPTTSLAVRISLALQANGPMASGALASAVAISQATLSRSIALLGPTIERIGAARSTRYALRRNIRNLGSQWPIYRIDLQGRATRWGDLRALHGGFRFAPSASAPGWLSKDYPSGVFSGLPFFLQDVRPQGYIGRAIARDASPDLGVPVDPRDWSDDDLVAYFLSDGHDLPGDLVFGDRALERALRQAGVEDSAIIPDAGRPAAYAARADAAQRGEVIGSSAGGEQPKFLATVRRPGSDPVSVIVKFSAAEASPVRQRWSDLLLCEHMAARVLARHGVPSAATQVLDGERRRFLEVERFDRNHAVGRRGMLTLGAIEDALVDQSFPDWNWAAAAAILESAGVMDAPEVRQLRWRWCFGDLIANSDMHRSNTSLWFGDSLPFGLTPSYDMLPMLFAPGAQGDLGPRTFSPRPPLPAVASVWPEAAHAAVEFWNQISGDERVSRDFRTIAQGASSEVNRLIARFA